MKLNVTVGLSLALIAVSSVALAENPKGFGDKSQLIISADRLVPLFSFAHASVTTNERGIDATQSSSGSGISLLFGRDAASTSLLTNPHSIPRVGIDFTVIQNLTVGGSIAFGFGLGGSEDRERVQGATVVTTSSDAPTGTAIGFAPRVGYVLGLNDWLAFWPRLGFAFYSLSSKTEDIENNNVVTSRSTTYTQLSLDVDPTLVFVPFEHFFFNVGPLLAIPFGGNLSTEVSRPGSSVTTDNDASVLHLGISAGLGGYFNL
jgi:hypothetical protein